MPKKKKKRKNPLEASSGLHPRHAELERVLERELGEGREGIPGPIVRVSQPLLKEMPRGSVLLSWVRL